MAKSLLLLVLCVCGVFAADMSGEWYLTVITQGERVASGQNRHTPDGKPDHVQIHGCEFKGVWRGTGSKRREQTTGAQPPSKARFPAITWKATPSSPVGWRGKWTADRIKPLVKGSKVHDFTPTQFQRYLSASIPPVLRIQPGDTVRTWSVDAGGSRCDGEDPVVGWKPAHRTVLH